MPIPPTAEVDWNVVYTVRQYDFFNDSYSSTAATAAFHWDVPAGIQKWDLYQTTDPTNYGAIFRTFQANQSSVMLSGVPQAPIYYRLIGTLTNGLTVPYNDLTVTSTPAVPGDLQWVDIFSCQSGSCIVTAVATDSVGNVIVGGYWSGTCDFLDPAGPHSSTFSPSAADGFIAKYSPSGAFIWFKQIGGNGNDAVKALVIDSQDNILAIGNFQQTVDFGGGNVTAYGAADLFVVKYHPDKSFGWVQHYKGLTSDVGRTIALVPSGNPAVPDNIVALADFAYGGDFGLGPLTGPTGGAADFDIAVAKLSGTDGTTLWQISHGGSNWEMGRAIAVDLSGNVVITGFAQGTSTDMGGGSISPAGSTAQYCAFVAKYGPSGSYLWSKIFGASGGNFGYGITTDSLGNVIFTGLHAGSTNFGGTGNLVSSGIFIVALEPTAGGFLWQIGTGGSGDSGASVFADANGNLGITGRASSAVYFGGTKSLFGNGQVNCFIAAFTLSGNSLPIWRWTKYYGDGYDGASNGNCVFFDKAGNLLAVGAFLSTEDFNPEGSTPFVKTAGQAGYSSGFLTKYSP